MAVPVDLSQQVRLLEERVGKLLMRLDELRAENQRLQQAHQQFLTDQKQQSGQLDDLQTRLAKANRALDEQRGRAPETFQQLRAQLDQHIAAIDTLIGEMR